MTKGALSKSSRGAVAAGATAAGAASLGAVALGAVALGAIAVGALAVGRLSVGRARLRRVEIGELAVGRLDVGADAAGGRITAVVRIRAAPGKGDALERLLLDQAAGIVPGSLLHRARRSRTDLDVFLFCSPMPTRQRSSVTRGCPGWTRCSGRPPRRRTRRGLR